MPASLPNFRVEEKKHFHPVVRQWLTDNGMIFDYEYPLLGRGRVDFVVRTDQGDYAVEAKLKFTGSGNTAIAQVQNYQHGLSKAKPCIAIPSGSGTSSALLNAKRLSVRVLEIPFDISKAVREDWLHSIRSKWGFILFLDPKEGLPYCMNAFRGALCEYIEHYDIPKNEWLSFPYCEYRSIFGLSHSEAESWATSCYDKLWLSRSERNRSRAVMSVGNTE